MTPAEKERLRSMILDAGAVAAGFSAADVESKSQTQAFASWLARGMNASMQWMESHARLRTSPENILPSASTIITAAFPFAPAPGERHNPLVAAYAQGDDYHKVLKRRLKPVTAYLCSEWGAKTRICVDSAPVAERYRALRAGIGHRGKSGMIIAPSGGCALFLAEILTDVAIEPDAPSAADFWEGCSGCTRCIDACPAKAIGENGEVDCRRCLSYLTIEHQGEWTGDISEPEAPLFGCDVCLRVCPAFPKIGTRLPEFAPAGEVVDFSRGDFGRLSADERRRRFAGKALVRIARRKK